MKERSSALVGSEVFRTDLKRVMPRKHQSKSGEGGMVLTSDEVTTQPDLDTNRNTVKVRLPNGV
jgi:hypothetical protein